MAFQGLYISKFSRGACPRTLLEVSRDFGACPLPPQAKTKLYAYGMPEKG